jgi:hypothetical protein
MRWRRSPRQRSIRSARALDELLEAYEWFDGGQCTSVSPDPTTTSTPARVELVLRDAGLGGLRAGDLRTYRELRLSASGVHEWSFEGDTFVRAPGHLITALESFESSSGFGFTTDLPTTITVTATSFEAEQLPDVVEPFEAWVCDHELFVAVPHAEAPAPAEWIDTILQHGVEVGWRTYGGEITPPDLVSADGYDGWFLERPERVGDHDGGVQIIIHHDAAGLTFKLDRPGDVVDDESWWAMCRSTATLFPDGEFVSGNSRFAADEWLTHVIAARESPGATVLNGVAVRSSHVREAHPMEVPQGGDPTEWRVRT